MNRDLLAFIAVSYGLAVLVAAGGAALADGAGDAGGPLLLLVRVVYMFTPMAGAVVARRLAGGPVWEPLGARVGLSRWLFAGPVIAIATCLLAVGTSLLLPDVRFTPGMEGLFERLAATLPPEKVAEARAAVDALPIHPFFLAIPQAFGAGLTINAFAAFGEEVGWRGYLTPRLGKLGFWGASGVTGLIWGFWHAPIILLLGHNYPDHRVAGVFLFAVVCVLLAPMHTLVATKGRTTWAAATCHGTINAAAGLPLLVLGGGTDLTVGVQGIGGVLALVVVNTGLFAWIGRGPEVGERAGA